MRCLPRTRWSRWCGGLAAAMLSCKSPAPPQQAQSAAVADPPADSQDFVVATVGDQPVWASCVRGQRATHQTSVEQALDDCIALELMAQEAARRGLSAHPDVMRQQREAMVDALYAKDFEAKHAVVAQLPTELVERAFAKNRHLMDQPEFRRAQYVRVSVPEGTPAGAPADLQAKALAGEIYAELGPQRGLLSEEVFATANRIANGRPLSLGPEPYATQRHGQSDEGFASALFAIPEIGRVSPPTRTKWGWDIVFLLDIAPAKRQTKDELLAGLFPALRRETSELWIRQRRESARPEVWPDRLDPPPDDR